MDKPLVVLAEDDGDLRALLAHRLELDGCRVAEAASGLELLAALRIAAGHTGNPTLVISDQRMPGLDGLGALELVRQSGSSIPFVLITAFGDDTLALRARGADAILLRKPIALDDLDAIVRRLATGGATGAAVACASCGAFDDPRPMAPESDVFFCRDCRALRDYDFDDPSVDLGGEG